MNSHDPAVSVLVAVRNGEEFLEAALASLAAQTFSDFEIVIVDNGSTDRTAQIMSGWEKRDPRLRAFHHDRPGLSGSLILAASHARAPLLARLDADDIALPERLAVQYAAMSDRPSLGLIGSWVELIDLDGRRIGERRLLVSDGKLRAFLQTGNPFCHSTIMMRRDAYERAGGYRPGLRICEDFDLWCRMAEVAELANIDQALVRYRLHDTSMSVRQPLRMAITDQCILAAGRARRQGLAEPFNNGTPRLRSALRILGVERSDFLYEVLKMTSVAARLALRSGDRTKALRLRRRSYGILLGMPKATAISRGLWRVIGTYFKPNSRRRRRDAVRRMFRRTDLT